MRCPGHTGERALPDGGKGSFREKETMRRANGSQPARFAVRESDRAPPGRLGPAHFEVTAEGRSSKSPYPPAPERARVGACSGARMRLRTGARSRVFLGALQTLARSSAAGLPVQPAPPSAAGLLSYSYGPSLAPSTMWVSSSRPCTPLSPLSSISPASSALRHPPHAGRMQQGGCGKRRAGSEG